MSESDGNSMESTERERLANIARIKGEIAGLEKRLNKKHDALAALVRAGLDTEMRTFAHALPVDAVQEVIVLAKIPGIKRLKELTSCDLRTAVHVYDILCEEARNK